MSRKANIRCNQEKMKALGLTPFPPRDSEEDSEENSEEDKTLSGPDPERITPASIEYAKDCARRKKPTGSHPCKVRTDLADFCSFHHYNSAPYANKHMRDIHHLAATDPIMYPATAKKKQPVTTNY